MKQKCVLLTGSDIGCDRSGQALFIEWLDWYQISGEGRQILQQHCVHTFDLHLRNRENEYIQYTTAQKLGFGTFCFERGILC